MNGIEIEVIDDTIEIVYEIPCCTGEIRIKEDSGEFKETFDMPLVSWSIDEYKKQWQEGLKRIKTYDTSCLVAEIQNPEMAIDEVAPRASIWPMYRIGDKIFVQNHLLFGKRFYKMLTKKPFALETCYDFVKPRETVSTDGITLISEWTVNLKDLL